MPEVLFFFFFLHQKNTGVARWEEQVEKAQIDFAPRSRRSVWSLWPDVVFHSKPLFNYHKVEAITVHIQDLCL